MGEVWKMLNIKHSLRLGEDRGAQGELSHQWGLVSRQTEKQAVPPPMQRVDCS